jgi:hypothetical protein
MCAHTIEPSNEVAMRQSGICDDLHAEWQAVHRGGGWWWWRAGELVAFRLPANPTTN